MADIVLKQFSREFIMFCAACSSDRTINRCVIFTFWGKEEKSILGQNNS